MLRPARAYPAGLLLLLAASLLLPLGAHGDPTVAPDGGGFKRATWDFATPGDYTATNADLAAGDASLATMRGWKNYTNDAEFTAAQQSVNRVVVNSGVRLAGNTANLISDGTFDLSPGPWTYTNGTTANVAAARDDTSKGKLWHETQRVQFDSLNDIFGTAPWAVSTGGAGSGGILNQETSVIVEPTGSMKDDLTIGSG
ncbi:MAG TPA: hypothetical protein VGR51_01450, partial [Thermoplasmata archaeon]|nr:hypothetical protein [Thermoplasmata archaeon]